MLCGTGEYCHYLLILVLVFWVALLLLKFYLHEVISPSVIFFSFGEATILTILIPFNYKWLDSYALKQKSKVIILLGLCLPSPRDWRSETQRIWEPNRVRCPSDSQKNSSLLLISLQKLAFLMFVFFVMEASFPPPPMFYILEFRLQKERLTLKYPVPDFLEQTHSSAMCLWKSIDRVI